MLRAAIVGVGENARDHGRACVRSNRVDLASICDVDPTALERFGGEYDVAPGSRYADLNEMLTSEQLEVVIVSTWGVHHAAIAKQVAAASGVRAILVEKPISMTAAQCQEMIDAASKHGVVLAEAFKWRHDPQHLRVVQLVREGRIGAVRAIHGFFTSPLVRFADADNWRYDSQKGGGSIYDTASYLVHFSRLMTGTEPTRAFATAAFAEGRPSRSAAELSAAIALSFADGAVAHLTSSYEYGYCQAVQVVGTEGWIGLDLPFDQRSVREQEFVEKEDLAATVQLHHDSFDSETYRFAPRNQFDLQLDHLCDAAEGSTAFRIEPEFSLGNMRALDAVRASIDAGAPVAVASD